MPRFPASGIFDHVTVGDYTCMLGYALPYGGHQPGGPANGARRAPYPSAGPGQANGGLPFRPGMQPGNGWPPSHGRLPSIGPAFPPHMLKPGEVVPSTPYITPIDFSAYLRGRSSFPSRKYMLCYSAVALLTLGTSGFFGLLGMLS